MRVLLVEDAQGLGDAVREQIADDGHAVDWVQRLSTRATVCAPRLMT
jgi:two-component system OmpR family response regulator